MAARTYRGKELDVSFDKEICIHAAECVRSLPEVFDVDRKPWILPDGGSAEAVRDVVARCPSGALEVVEKSAEAAADAVKIQAMDGGPFVVSGAVRVVAQDGTLIKEGPKMALCRCGKSDNSPFCDGSHAR
jgi:uncharacterized Fe-S cluster protein YjdI